MKQTLFSRNFALVVIGQIISLFGSAILRFAMNLYVLDMTGRADVFAAVVAISAIPGIFFTPIGGGIADRFSRRNLMVILDFTSSAVIFLLLFLIGSGHGTVLVIGIILALLSVISSIYQPTVQASIPLLVPQQHLTAANGIVNGVGALSGMLGPVIGGVLYGVIGIQALVIASSAAFFLSAVMELFIQIPFVKKITTEHILPTIVHDLKIGVQYITTENRQIISIIILATLMNLFMAPVLLIGVPYILRITMQSSETMYGVGMGIVQFSALLGALLIGKISRRLQVKTLHRFLFAAAVLIVPVATAVTPTILSWGYWPSFLLFFSFAAMIMLLVTVISIFIITAVQIQTPNDMLGKVMAIIMAVSHCAAPLGQALYGLLFEAFSTRVYVPILMAGAFTAFIAALGRRLLSGQHGQAA